MPAASLRYGSVCSGIEAPTVAWHPLGFVPAWFAEVDPFPSAVLAHHYPGVRNLGDMTEINCDAAGAIDLLVGGTPCQSFSVAGLRKGMADDRGNLALHYCRLAFESGARWVVWENVPGVFSSSEGRDFASFLSALTGIDLEPPADGWQNSGVIAGAPDCFGVAWRVLDAQYAGVPQRRRRVFVVGYLGDWRPAAAVLLERHSLQGHSPPRRQAREGVASCLGTRSADGSNERGDGSANLQAVAHSLRADGFDASEDGTGRGTPLVPIAFSCKDSGLDASDQAPTLRAMGHDGSHANAGGQVAVAFNEQHSNQGFGQDVSITLGAETRAAVALPDTLYNQGSQTGAVDAGAQEAHARDVLRVLRQTLGAEAFAEWGLGVLDSLHPPEVLRSGVLCSVEDGSLSEWRAAGRGALQGADAHREAVLRAMRLDGESRRSPSGPGPAEQLCRESAGAVSFLSSQDPQPSRLLLSLWEASEGLGVLRQALSAVQEVRRPVDGQAEPAHAPGQERRLTSPQGGQGLAVRRLTPLQLECERLQGFPDGYTLIPYRRSAARDFIEWLEYLRLRWAGLSEEQARLLAVDGPRYRALGNSMAVPVMRWIGERIALVDQVLADIDDGVMQHLLLGLES